MAKRKKQKRQKKVKKIRKKVARRSKREVVTRKKKIRKVLRSKSKRKSASKKKRAPKKRKVHSVRVVPVVKSDEPLLELMTGSAVRARMMRLLLREPQLLFSLQDVSERLRVSVSAVRQEARRFESFGLITLRGGKRLAVNPTFSFLSEFRALAVRPFPVSRQWLVRTLSSAGKLQLVIVSGVFLEASQARVDIFVVASRYSEKRLENAAKKIEAAVGAELRWAGMETKEFNYRWRMFDRFLRDIFTQPHERVLEKIKITT